MKIISYNVNGIRAAITKGFVEWIREENPDVIHIQETKANEDQVDLSIFNQLGYEWAWFSAQKKGYSGVATFYKKQPDIIKIGIDIESYDNEGRFIRLDYENITLLNSYFPSGTTGDIRQTVKEQYLEDVLLYINKLKQTRPNIILSGDFNICHKPIDINHPERHKNSSGFLPNEREWIDRLLQSGFTDSFRMFDNEPNKYSWWSYRANSREKNLGWRIDYNMVSDTLKSKVTNAYILPDVKHSDHCPVVIELDI